LETRDQPKVYRETPEISDRDSSVPHLTPGVILYALTIIFLIFFALWILLSGKLDFFHLGLGAISCIIVTLFSGDLLLPEIGAKGLLRHWGRFVLYIPWLLYQIVLANVHILYIVFHPRMTDIIDPRIIRFRSALKKDLSLVTFANSITLTPGTITIYVSVDQEFKVHAIDGKCGESLPGEMESRVARTMGEIG
jgi:multicomponent Na+:H+ antiporter subunit E